MKHNNITTQTPRIRVGEISNPIVCPHINKPAYDSLAIRFPCRLNAMALDPSKIVLNENNRYAPGEIIFKVKIYNRVIVRHIPNSNDITVSVGSRRKPLILHTALLIKQALKANAGLYIDVDSDSEIPHSGLGSSSRLIASVATAINELFGNPIQPQALAKYLAQNHGEEIDGEHNYLTPVQCIGGSAVGGLFKGGIHIISGEVQRIASANIDQSYRVVIGIPNNIKQMDSKILLAKEIKNFPKFVHCGEKYGAVIAYRLIHNAIPQMLSGDLSAIGNLIFDYRFNMGSIRNCSFAYPIINKIAKQISKLKYNNVAEILALSSVGPGFFAISKTPKICEVAFRKSGMRTIITDIENDKYKVLWKKK